MGLLPIWLSASRSSNHIRTSNARPMPTDRAPSPSFPTAMHWNPVKLRVRLTFPPLSGFAQVLDIHFRNQGSLIESTTEVSALDSLGSHETPSKSLTPTNLEKCRGK